MAAKVIMVQGTMSNSGKSFITAGLCRVFYQDGYKVAPFKSQNMALNSYITKDGLEIGRAQAMQAEAAHIEPTVYMNPILLKPTSNVGSQVIVNGEVLDHMKAMDYYQYKTKLIPDILKAYEVLSKEYDIIVIEGAGSPAEINLKENDIVNMGLAKMVKAPVILVADIDRGGVFASIYGTVALLDLDEQEMIKGTVINKFRGDVKILEPGLRMIEEKTNIPVIGVVPMEYVDIDDEDSLSERLTKTEIGNGIDIAVIKLPHMSNFTDFSIFERMDGVTLRYVNNPNQLKNPDLILIPGTKNTMEDMKWLRESGMEVLILRCAELKIHIIGICGGFQLLGKELVDPYGVESKGSITGLGLLDAKTVFQTSKTRTQIKGRILNPNGLFKNYTSESVWGYEIHMGVTKNLGKCREMIQLEDGRMDGLSNEDGTVMGSYLHGLFDSYDLAQSMIMMLAEKKGIDINLENVSLEEYKEEQYDKLASIIRKSMDMDKIYKILEEGV